MWVQEIFKTVQGEGVNTGRPSVFVRLAGCNLACKFCDTEFESAFDDIYNCRTVQSIVNEIELKGGGLRHVVLTGGEPLRQNIVPLVDTLLSQGYTIEMETAGTIWVPGLSAYAVTDKFHITVSPKTGHVCSEIAQFANAWKYIIKHNNTSSIDGLPIIAPSTDKNKILQRPTNNSPVYVQPCDDQEDALNELNREETKRVALEYNYYISIQTHKLLGVR